MGTASLTTLMGELKSGCLIRNSSTAAATVWAGEEKGCCLKFELMTESIVESLPESCCARARVCATEPVPPEEEKVRWVTAVFTALR